MIPRLLDHLPLVNDRLAAAAHVLLGLDYDGTLTPIVDEPSSANLAPETRAVLQALAGRPGFSVALVSGRTLDDLRQRVDVAGLIYAGNHGLDVSGPGIRFIEPGAVKARRALGWLARILTGGLAHIAGAVVENKALTLSVHVRHVLPAQLPEVRRNVESAVAAVQHRFRIRLGNQVFEVLPRVDWNKGSALCWIKDRIAPVNAVVLYLGDDRTDEDAFLALSNEITVKVGAPALTLANYHLEGPAQVQEFLLWLERACPERS